MVRDAEKLHPLGGRGAHVLLERRVRVAREERVTVRVAEDLPAGDGPGRHGGSGLRGCRRRRGSVRAAKAKRRSGRGLVGVTSGAVLLDRTHLLARALAHVARAHDARALPKEDAASAGVSRRARRHAFPLPADLTERAHTQRGSAPAAAFTCSSRPASSTRASSSRWSRSSRSSQCAPSPCSQSCRTERAAARGPSRARRRRWRRAPGP